MNVAANSGYLAEAYLPSTSDPDEVNLEAAENYEASTTHCWDDSAWHDSVFVTGNSSLGEVLAGPKSAQLEEALQKQHFLGVRRHDRCERCRTEWE